MRGGIDLMSYAATLGAITEQEAALREALTTHRLNLEIRSSGASSSTSPTDVKDVAEVGYPVFATAPPVSTWAPNTPPSCGDRAVPGPRNRAERRARMTRREKKDRRRFTLDEKWP